MTEENRKLKEERVASSSIDMHRFFFALYHPCNISTLQYLIITNYWHYLMSAF